MDFTLNIMGMIHITKKLVSIEIEFWPDTDSYVTLSTVITWTSFSSLWYFSHLNNLPTHLRYIKDFYTYHRIFPSYCILALLTPDVTWETHQLSLKSIWFIMITLYAKQKKRHRCTEQTCRLWEKVRVGCFERTASKHVYYQGWNRSPAQVGGMRQVLGPGALGRPRGMDGEGWGRGDRDGEDM